MHSSYFIIKDMIKHEDWTRKKTISLPKSILAKAMQRAKVERRSFSNYLQLLIARDIERGREEEAQLGVGPAK